MMGQTTSVMSPDVEWSIGDGVLAAVEAGRAPETARDNAARTARRELHDITWIVRTCEAFPPGHRRACLPYVHHRAVLDLPEDDRDAMLVRALERGWSARQTRREVLKARIAAGAYFPPVDDDPEDRQYRSIVRAWNCATSAARELFAGSVEEAGTAEIML